MDIKQLIKERMIRFSEPSETLFNSHINKAKHNLDVAVLMKENNFSDWQIVASYYTIYHSLLALLARVGIISKNHSATIDLVERIFVGDHISREDMAKIRDIKSIKELFDPGEIEEIRRIRSYRIEAQYSIKTSFQQTIADEALDFARNFLSKTQTIQILDEIYQKVKYIKNLAKTQGKKS